jgi:hypothetical protein
VPRGATLVTAESGDQACVAALIAQHRATFSSTLQPCGEGLSSSKHSWQGPSGNRYQVLHVILILCGLRLSRSRAPRRSPSTMPSWNAQNGRRSFQSILAGRISEAGGKVQQTRLTGAALSGDYPLCTGRNRIRRFRPFLLASRATMLSHLPSCLTPTYSTTLQMVQRDLRGQLNRTGATHDPTPTDVYPIKLRYFQVPAAMCRGSTEPRVIAILPGKQIWPPCVCPASKTLKSARAACR